VIRRYGSQLRAALVAADAFVAVALLIALSVVRFGGAWVDAWHGIVPEPLLLLVAYVATWVLVLTFAGLYRPRARWSIRSEAMAIVRATIFMALISLSLLFLLHLPDVSRLFLLALFPIQAAVTLLSRLALRRVFESLRRRGYNARFVLVLGAGPRGQSFASRLEEHRALGLRIAGFLDDDPEYGARLPARWAYLGGLDRLESILHERVVDEVAVCLPFTQWTLIDAICAICEEEGKIVRIPMDVLDRAIATGQLEDLDGLPVFSLITGPDRTVALFVKRVIDIAGASIGLVLLAPVMLVCAISVVAEDGRPVLFHQVRLGLHGRPFRLVKLRSMSADAEQRRSEIVDRNEIHGRAFKVTDDPRVTRVGRRLRRFSLDELPQLWNVLHGDMSLVGPRPPLPEEVAGYDLWHRRRLSMKPGMTGLWQVAGRRETDFDRWVAADLEYIDRWSLWLDLRILARTIPAAFQGR